MQYIRVFFISMLPLIELRGAIPYSQVLELPLFPSYAVAILGNILPVPVIYLFARKVLVWGRDIPYIGRFFAWCIVKGENSQKKIQEKAKNGIFVALFLFVGIPLPGTGAWTGTLAASFLDLKFKETVLAVSCGVLLSGIIMAIGTTGVLKFFQIF